MPTPKRHHGSASAWRLDGKAGDCLAKKIVREDPSGFALKGDSKEDLDDASGWEPWDVAVATPRGAQSPKNTTPRFRHSWGGGCGEQGEVRRCLELVAERLAQMERRLERWQAQHDWRLEHALSGKPCGMTRRARCTTRASNQSASEPAESAQLGVVSEEVEAKEEEEGTIWMPKSSSVQPTSTWVPDPSAQGRNLGCASRIILDAELGKYRTKDFHNTDTAPQVQKARSTRRGSMPVDSMVGAWVYFDHFFAFVIVLNAIFLAVQTEYGVRTADSHDAAAEAVFTIFDKFFAAMVLIELLIRLVATKLEFFYKAGCAWNYFDLALVLLSMIEAGFEIRGFVFAAAEDAANVQIMRIFRMVRVVRLMRVLRFLDELRTMLVLILNSMRSLFWLLVLLTIILFVFSIFFTQGIADYLDSAEEGPTAVQLKEAYGSLFESSFTLFMAITGGVSWIDVVKPLQETGWVFTALFILYVSFCVFSVLNIVTGVFVDGAIQRSAQERDLRLEKEKEMKELYVSMLMDLLTEIDTEGTGFISRSMLEEAFERERVKYTFSVLDIDIHDSNYLFDMLDLDRSGEVDMDEFVLGCLRLKGNAKSIDIHTLMFEIRHLIRKWDTMFASEEY